MGKCVVRPCSSLLIKCCEEAPGGLQCGKEWNSVAEAELLTEIFKVHQLLESLHFLNSVIAQLKTGQVQIFRKIPYLQNTFNYIFNDNKTTQLLDSKLSLWTNCG